MISWNGRDLKYDLRDWVSEHEKMRKGIVEGDEDRQIYDLTT
ncbi:hypothetical protein HMJ28_00060 [Clostridium cochlearium]|uniref:Uncharacterized protein n=1 Tax=Clostridium cochlearium TaxID=1494 RepID=A0A7Y3XXF2_CLOCO|nr:hypothetical protein [Clostridium cochlearium]